MDVSGFSSKNFLQKILIKIRKRKIKQNIETKLGVPNNELLIYKKNGKNS